MTPTPTITSSPTDTPTASNTPTASSTPTITPSPTPTVPPNRILVAASGNLAGQHSSLALTADDVPVVSHQRAGVLQLHFFRCADASCPITGNTEQVLNSSGNTGQYSSIVVDASGIPVNRYRDEINDDLKVVC